MNLDDFYTQHWKQIEDERFARYEKMFVWGEGQLELLEPADIQAGHRVLDLGCGPGSLSFGISGLVGASGMVQGVDINEQFVSLSKQKYKEHRNISFRKIEDHHLPFESDFFDRVVCKNVLEYVPDLSQSLAEVRRVLKPSGKLHVIDSDWGFVIVEPWSKETIVDFFDAASPAFKEPQIGRKLMGVMKQAGFKSISVVIVPFIDQSGSGLNVLNNMASYIENFGTMPSEKLRELIEEAEKSVEKGTFFFCLPQFLVTASEQGGAEI